MTWHTWAAVSWFDSTGIVILSSLSQGYRVRIENLDIYCTSYSISLKRGLTTRRQARACNQPVMWKSPINRVVERELFLLNSHGCLFVLIFGWTLTNVSQLSNLYYYSQLCTVVQLENSYLTSGGVCAFLFYLYSYIQTLCWNRVSHSWCLLACNLFIVLCDFECV